MEGKNRSKDFHANGLPEGVCMKQEWPIPKSADSETVLSCIDTNATKKVQSSVTKSVFKSLNPHSFNIAALQNTDVKVEYNPVEGFHPTFLKSSRSEDSTFQFPICIRSSSSDDFRLSVEDGADHKIIRGCGISRIHQEIKVASELESEGVGEISDDRMKLTNAFVLNTMKSSNFIPRVVLQRLDVNQVKNAGAVEQTQRCSDKHSKIISTQRKSLSENRTTKRIRYGRKRTVQQQPNSLRPHTCTYCPSKFKQVHHLRDHIKAIHTGERPYRCKDCPAAYIIKCRLKYHLSKNIHHRPLLSDDTGHIVKQELKLENPFGACKNNGKRLANNFVDRPPLLNSDRSSYREGQDRIMHAPAGHQQSILTEKLNTEDHPKHASKKRLCLRQSSLKSYFSNNKENRNRKHPQGSKPGLHDQISSAKISETIHLSLSNGKMWNEISLNKKYLRSSQHGSTVSSDHSQNDLTNTIMTESSFTKSISSRKSKERCELRCLRRSHMDEKPFSCSQSVAKFSQKKQLNRHISINTGKRPYACSECSAKFRQKQNLNVHMLTHTGEKPFNCSECSAKFRQIHHLRGHMLTHTGEKPFNCSECSAKFTQKRGLNAHMLIHTGEKPFNCSECPAKFRQICHLRGHMLTHTGEKPFNCSECSAKFRQIHHLKDHMLNHTGKKPFACSECSKIFRLKQSLKQHMLTHTGEKPFNCSKCPAKFRQICHLRGHMLTHTGEKPFNCSECSAKFRRTHHLKGHMLTHSAEKLFACSECSAKFTHKQSLNKHMLTHTGQNPFTRSECSAKI